ncbi:MAG: hypothetical protein NC102_06790 [Clostridium sp.]|nr:hypothetical protein [Clostridium sp.]
MKGRTLTFFGILAAVVAAALIIARNSITPLGVVLTGGILFILAGLANCIAISRNKEAGAGKVFGYVANAASIVFGICMIAFQGSFVPLVTFIFGLLVAMLAIWQFYVLAAAVRPHVLPGWLYVFPIALAVAATYIFVAKDSVAQLPIILVTGISAAVLAAGCLVEGSMLGAARRMDIKAAKKAQEEAKGEGAKGKEADKGESDESEELTKAPGIEGPKNDKAGEGETAKAAEKGNNME